MFEHVFDDISFSSLSNGHSTDIISIKGSHGNKQNCEE
jgi:hypothetical protein